MITRTNNILQAHGGVDELLDELLAIEKSNDVCTSKRMRGCIFVGAGMLISLLLTAVFPPLLLLGVIAVIWGGITAWQAGSKLVPDGRFDFLRELVATLAPDLSGKKALLLTCCLEETELKRKRTDYQSSFWSNVTVATYVDGWLDCQLKLADGNVLKLGIETTLVVKAKQKRKRTKRRAKTRHKVALRLAVSPRSFRGYRPADALVGADTGDLTFSAINCEATQVRATAVTRATNLTPFAVLKAVSALYSLLIPLDRRTHKKAKRAATPAA